MPTPRSSAMVGSEMLTMLPLRVLMKAPTETAESTSHFWLLGEEACSDVTSKLLSSWYQRARPAARTHRWLPLCGAAYAPVPAEDSPGDSGERFDDLPGPTAQVTGGRLGAWSGATSIVR